jgi:hypothetical protein
MSAVMRIEQVVARKPQEPLPWRWFWVGIVFLGAVMGAFQWGVGGWFYGLRIRWSGATNVDKYQARVVYAYSSLIYALPGLAVLSIQTVVFPTLIPPEQRALHSGILCFSDLPCGVTTLAIPPFVPASM